MSGYQAQLKGARFNKKCDADFSCKYVLDNLQVSVKDV